VFQDEHDMELVGQDFATVATKIDTSQLELAKYFTLIKNINKLKGHLLKSSNVEWVEWGIIELLAKASKSTATIIDCAMNTLTPELMRVGFTVVDCMTATLKTDESKQSYARPRDGGAKRRDVIATRLSEHGFNITEKRDYMIFTKLKAGVRIE
jgi:hypothetical protein